MEDRLIRLEQALENYLHVIGEADVAVLAQKSDAIEKFHVELLDFDGLRVTLNELKEILCRVRQDNLDASTVRNWLVGRIAALRRGRKAICSETVGENETDFLSGYSLSELVNRFEEESSLLRKMAGVGLCQKQSKTEQYQPYKS